MIRIAYSKYGILCEAEENESINLCIEEPEVFSEMMEDLWKQMNGKDGAIIVSNGVKNININKYAEMIVTPFSIDSNEKRIIAKLYKELNEIAVDELFEEMGEVNTTIVRFLDILLERSQYNLTSEWELDILGLLKLYNIKVASDGEDIISKFISYIRALSNICGINTVFTLNLKQYMSDIQLQQVYEFCRYQKVTVINLEGAHKNIDIEYERNYILDRDLCFFEV